MRHRALDYLLGAGMVLVAFGTAIGLVFFLIALFGGGPLPTTLPLAFDGVAHQPVTLHGTGAAAGSLVRDHGTLTVRAGGAAYLIGQGLDIVLVGGLLLVILYRLRQVVRAVAGGEPFRHDTIRSLRIIGWCLIVLNLWAWVRLLVLPLMLLPALGSAAGWRLMPAISRGLPGEAVARVDAHLPIVPLLVGLLVLVLAEAFRAGQALREDNEAIV